MRKSRNNLKTTQRPPTPLKPSIDYETAWAKLANIDYSFYVEYTNPGYKHGPHTELICKELQAVERGETKRLMIFLPPRHSKSYTVTGTFPSYFIGKKPSRKVIETSYGEELAIGFGRNNLHKIQEYGESIFNIKVAEDHARAGDWGIEGHEGGMKSAGIGGTVTGKGADLLLVDDPIKNAEQANSKTYREKLWDEYRTTLYTRLQPGGAIILLFTRWHEDDLAGRILADPELRKGWKIISLPAEAEENDILGRPVGAPLWPDWGFGTEWIQETKRAVGSKVWTSLYQQHPSPDAGQVFKREWLQQFYKKAPERMDIIIQSWDATFKELADNDFVVGQVWGKKGADYYLLDQIRARMDFTGTLTSIRTLTGKWPAATMKVIEDKANGPAIISTLKREIHGIIPEVPTGSKEARAQSVAPLYEAGNVWLPDPTTAPWIGDYIEELVSFPSAAHDDQVDASSQALNRLSNKFVTFGAVSKPNGF